jgi:hypothetical protein
MERSNIFLKSAASLVWLVASAVLYKLNTKTGKLAKAGVLHTDGQAAQYDLYFFQVQQAVAPEASCIFALDTGSSDIAAFSKSSGYERVGRYFKAELIAGNNGGSLILVANGKFLYANYGETGNIGLWSYGADSVTGHHHGNPQRQVSRAQRQWSGTLRYQ